MSHAVAARRPPGARGSVAGRALGDLLRPASSVSRVPLRRRVTCGEALAPAPLSWSAVFLTAYADLCATHPALNRATDLHPPVVLPLLVERPPDGDPWVFSAAVGARPAMSLHAVDELVRSRADASPHSVRAGVRHLVAAGGGPGRTRSGGKPWFLGSLAVGVAAPGGGDRLQLLSPLTTRLDWGFSAPGRTLDIRVDYDPRMLDGGEAARTADHLESLVHEQLCAGLHTVGRNSSYD